MAKSILILTHGETSGTFRGYMNFSSTDPKGSLQNLINYLNGVKGGQRQPISIESRMGETAATATITSTGAATADETLVVNGVTFTAKASGATGNQFNLSGTVATQATNIANAINNSSSAGVSNVTASASLGVVTLTCDIPGTVGNGFTLSESMSNVAVSGSNFAGGASDLDPLRSFVITPSSLLASWVGTWKVVVVARPCAHPHTCICPSIKLLYPL